jgi:hypothetical protein
LDIAYKVRLQCRLCNRKPEALPRLADEMRKLKNAALERLMSELEQAVAKHLRVPGR